MVVFANIIAYMCAVIQPVPFIIVYYFIRKQPNVHKTIKIFWYLGMSFGIVFAVQCFFLVNPELYLKWYGLLVMGLTLILMGLEHFIWGTEYFYSSENLLKGTTSKEI